MNDHLKQEQISRYLLSQLPEQERILCDRHLAHCSDCQDELEASRHIWNLMSDLAPEPAPTGMRSRFQAMLNDYKKQNVRESRWRLAAGQLRDWWQNGFRVQWAYTLSLLLIGLIAGYFIADLRGGSGTREQVKDLSAQVQSMKQAMTISLLENPSASERIRAVNYTSESGSANRQVIDALFTTLNEDPNVNVRLVTLEALVSFARDPAVRQGLIRSIAQQESPLMQSAIAGAMVKLQEKKSVKPLRELLDRKDVNEMVKVKIRQSIQQLI